jgi:hypothetical protein
LASYIKKYLPAFPKYIYISGGIKRRMGRREEEECFLFPFEEMTYIMSQFAQLSPPIEEGGFEVEVVEGIVEVSRFGTKILLVLLSQII